MESHVQIHTKLHDIEVVAESMRPIRKRPRHSGLSDYIMDSTTGHRDSLNTSQFLKVTYYSVLVCMLTEMNRRFSEKNLQLMRAIQGCTCNPKSA